MAPWVAPALLATACVGGHWLTLRAASGKVGDTLGALVLEGTAALGILALYLVGPRSEVATTGAGLLWSAASGLCITGASILIFMALRQGGPVSATGTVVMGGGVALSALLAPVLYGEAMSGRRFVGVALGVLAIVVLATERR
jgi:transporter family protein